MYDRRFFRSKLGRAAILSILAMLAVNVVALDARLGDVPTANGTDARHEAGVA